MKRSFLFVVVLLLLAACGGSDSIKTTGKPENDVDAASMFIRAALDGRYKYARTLIVNDSANIEDLAAVERIYQQRMDAMVQRGLRESQITIYDTRKISDSASMIIYSNTFEKVGGVPRKDSIKAVRIGPDWLVDFHATFGGKLPAQ